MSDIINRDELERRLSRKLGKLNRAQLSRLLEYLGDPPKMENVPQVFWDEAGRELAQVLGPFLEDVYVQQSLELMNSQPIGIDWAVVNQGAVDWARDYTFNLVGGINDHSRMALQSTVSAYYDRGQTIGELTGRLSNIFGPHRAEMIAVTEITRAAAQGEIGVVRELNKQGVQMVPVWQTNNDSLVCPLCGPRHDKVIEDGVYPPMHPRCRCWVNHEFADLRKPRARAELTQREWVASLTSEELTALREWGRFGNNLRKLQSGNTSGMTAKELARARDILPHWESAMRKGVNYKGEITRGLSNVPYDAVENWMKKGMIELTNDQSASYDVDIGQSFAVQGYGNKNSVVWKVDQNSGVNLVGQTNVTMGGKLISESEIIMRNGSKYKINAVEYMQENGKLFNSDWYFEGTSYSWPNNPPSIGWHPGTDFKGHYIIELIEVYT